MTARQNITVMRDSDGHVMSIDMIMPSNFHAHFRLDEMMRAISRDIMRWVKYILAMPNDGVIDTVEKVKARYDQLCEMRDKLGFHQVQIIVTIYATDKLTPKVIEQLATLPFYSGDQVLSAAQGRNDG